MCKTTPQLPESFNDKSEMQVLASRNVELILGFLVANMRSADDIASPRKPGSKGVILELIQATRGPSRRKVDGPTLEADLVLWTVGPQASLPPAETQAGYQAFPLNVRGQADTDEMLRVKGHPRIFAIGDSAGTKDDSGRLLPATAQVDYYTLAFLYSFSLAVLSIYWVFSTR